MCDLVSSYLICFAVYFLAGTFFMGRQFIFLKVVEKFGSWNLVDSIVQTERSAFFIDTNEKFTNLIDWLKIGSQMRKRVEIMLEACERIHT